MSLRLRYMRRSDVPEVVAIDQRAFTTPWPAHSYNYEITESTYSYMVVLDTDSSSDAHGGLNRLLRMLSGKEANAQILGYGGLWNIQDEAHISTIATHPNWRGKSFGELLLVAMIKKSLLLDAGYIVLEVRVSNTIAQNLYRKYDFVIADVKRDYYRDDNEDAYDMRLDLRSKFDRARFESQSQSLLEHLDVVDQYTNTPHPRLSR